jgi:hypothetical protein
MKKGDLELYEISYGIRPVVKLGQGWPPTGNRVVGVGLTIN